MTHVNPFYAARSHKPAGTTSAQPYEPVYAKLRTACDADRHVREA